MLALAPFQLPLDKKIKILGPEKRTIACVYPRLCSCGFSDQDGRVRVVFLHRWVGTLDERSKKQAVSNHLHRSMDTKNSNIISELGYCSRSLGSPSSLLP